MRLNFKDRFRVKFPDVSMFEFLLWRDRSMGFPPFCGESLKNLPILNICIKLRGAVQSVDEKDRILY